MGNGLVTATETGFSAAFQQFIKEISIESYNSHGVAIEFSVTRLQKLSQLYDMTSFLNSSTIDDKLMGYLLREYVIHSQQYVIQPNVRDVSHTYKTWMDVRDESWYARSLPETKSQFTVPMSDEEKEALKKNWLTKWPRLQIKENDPEDVKKSKQQVIDQIPHALKVGDSVFTRKEFIDDQSTSFFLGCFAQWFVEQAFKTGPDPLAKVGIESLHTNEFKRQWGNNKIDLSNIYGENENITTALRLGKGGRMKVQYRKVGEYTCEFPPKLTFKTSNIADDEVSQKDVNMFYPSSWSQQEAEKNLYALGHPRHNLHFGLTFIATLWIREHNLTAKTLEDAHKDDKEWDDERIFQTTRLILICELMKVVIEDYIKHIMTYRFTLKYNPEILHNTEFQYHERAHYEFNYLYRWHAMVPDVLTLNGTSYDYGKDLQFKPKITEELGLKQLFTDTTNQNIGQLGLNNTPDFLKFLDITTLLHSRVLKTQSYTQYREAFDGTKITDFDQISSDDAIQKQLRDIYGSVDNIDYYVGLLAEDLLPHGPVGRLMQTQLGIYAFSAIYSNPLNSPQLFNKDTFTEEGLERIKETRLSKLINRNLQEDGAVYGKPATTLPEDANYDCFIPQNGSFSIPNTDSSVQQKRRAAGVVQEAKKWPVDDKPVHQPVHIGPGRAKDIAIIVDTLMMDHTSVLLKGQLAALVHTIKTSLQVPKAFLSTFKTQLDVILSIATSKNKKHISRGQATRVMNNLNQLVLWDSPKDDIIDAQFGQISKLWGLKDVDRLLDFNWMRDDVFGETIMNGLDPTQLQTFATSMWESGKPFAKFNNNDVIEYFEKRFEVKLLDAIAAGHVLCLDSFDLMNLCEANAANVARPRTLFYYDLKNKILLPFAIQLNSLNSIRLNITVQNATGLKPMDGWINNYKADPWVKLTIDKVSKSTEYQKSTLNPTWNQTLSFDVLPNQDVIKIDMFDKDFVGVNEAMGSTTLKIASIKNGKNQLDFKIGGGTLNMLVDKDQSLGAYEERILLPTHNHWTLAKFYVGNAYVVVHEIVSHNLKCHSVMEVVSMCMHNKLYREHPIFALLTPHVDFTDVINLLARKTLLKDNGSGLVSVLFSCGIDGYKINDAAWKTFDYSKYAFKQSMTDRDINLPTYWFKQDGTDVWNAIEKYVAKSMKAYYGISTDIDEVVRKDYELASFVSMLSIYIPGIPEVNNFDRLVYLLTSFIFNGSAMHTALHWSQMDTLSFAPLLPTILNLPPPRFDDESFGKVENGKLNARQQQICMKFLPTLGQSIMINATFSPVTKTTDKPLIQDGYNPFPGGDGMAAFKEFQTTLNTIAKKIKERGKYEYLSSVSRSVNF